MRIVTLETWKKVYLDIPSSLKKTLCIWAIFLLGKCGVLHI